MKRQRVFCEIDFYKQFVNSYPKEVIPSEENIIKTKLWIDFNSFLFKSDIHFDIDADIFRILIASDEYFKVLWKKSTNGECGVEFDSVEFPKITEFDKVYENKVYLESVYLSCESDSLCREVENAYGVKVISIDNITKAENLFNVHIETVEKGDESHSNWDFLSVFSHPCNSLAVVDNYILKDTIAINENLIAILDKILPSKLEIPFHISVFAKNDYHNKERCELITKSLEELRPNIVFKISVFQLRNEFHDRTLITNYLILDSGSGFDLFSNRKSKNQTKITGYYPFSASNLNIDVRHNYYVLRKLMKEVYDKSVSNENFQNVWGEKENRLFEN